MVTESKILLLMSLFSFILPPVWAQAKSGPENALSKILADTDDSCRLMIDGADEGVLSPAQSKKISVSLGDHIVKCTVENVPDLMWRKIVTVKTSDQVPVLIALKALHIQYDQAVGKGTAIQGSKAKQSGAVVDCAKDRQSKVHLFGDSSPRAIVVADVACGDEVQLVDPETNGGYYKVRSRNGTEGWIWELFLKIDSK
jgi:hypothetical protein